MTQVPASRKRVVTAAIGVGATVTQYAGPGGAITIPDSIDIAGETYDVVPVDQSVFQR